MFWKDHAHKSCFQVFRTAPELRAIKTTTTSRHESLEWFSFCRRIGVEDDRHSIEIETKSICDAINQMCYTGIYIERDITTKFSI